MFRAGSLLAESPVCARQSKRAAMQLCRCALAGFCPMAEKANPFRNSTDVAKGEAQWQH